MAPRSRSLTNWAGNRRWTPERIVDARGKDDVVAAVAQAAERGVTVKAIGAGHSFTEAATTTGVQVRLSHLDELVSVDREAKRVTVGGGITLHRLNDVMAAHGLALPNLGDIDRQSISGAIATATHGTGIDVGNLASQVVGMELVDGRGRVLRFDPGDDPDGMADIAPVHLGALGVVTEVTLQCVDTFNLHASETFEPIDELLERLPDEFDTAEHVEFYWQPGSRRCHVKRNRRTDEPARPPSRVAYLRDKVLIENVAFGVVCRVGRRFPSLVRPITRLIGSAAAERDVVDRSDRVFCSPRHVRFVEMEYGIPLESIADAVRAVRSLTTTLPTPALFPIEVRASAADGLALSTGFGRTSGWIAVHQYRGVAYDEYFNGVESIMAELGGRPHWGKLHGQSARTLAPRYPRWDDFAALRDRLDPHRTFANPYLTRVLGS